MGKSSGSLSRFLVPVDGSKFSKRATYFAGCLALSLKNRVDKITLLHVMAGGYLSRHMVNIDKRTESILDNETIKKLREDYMESYCAPFMNEHEEILAGLGVRKEMVDRQIMDGQPADKIVETAENGGYSTIIMGRRGLSPIKEILLGSVTNKILHLPRHPSMYVVGQEVRETETCLVPSILIPVDGSTGSLAAVKEACIFGQYMPECVNRIILLKVIDLASYDEMVAKREAPESEAAEILDQAAQLLMDSGIPGHKIIRDVRYGCPIQTILDFAGGKGINLIIIGRYGRSVLRDFVVGGVSSQILHRAITPTVAIINEER